MSWVAASSHSAPQGEAWLWTKLWDLYRTDLSLPVFGLFHHSGSSWAYLAASCLPCAVFLGFFLLFSSSLDSWSPGQSVQVDKAFCPIYTQRVIHCLFTFWNARVEALQDVIQHLIPSVELGWLLGVDETTLLYWNLSALSGPLSFLWLTHVWHPLQRSWPTFLSSSPIRNSLWIYLLQNSKLSCWLVKRERDV